MSIKTLFGKPFKDKIFVILMKYSLFLLLFLCNTCIWYREYSCLSLKILGSMGPPKREKAWHEKRVFFLTPQVLTNDLSRGSCPAEDVKCLVIDEAHKALGNHAYCQVTMSVGVGAGSCIFPYSSSTHQRPE